MRHLYDRYNGLKHQIRDVEGLLVAHRQQVREGESSLTRLWNFFNLHIIKTGVVEFTIV